MTMALIRCDECGAQISDRANTCPKCGNPIAEIRLAEIDSQNREYYKGYNKQMLLVNIVAFLVAMFAGYRTMIGELQPWKLIVVVVCVLFFLLMSISWVQWIAAISLATQEYKHIPKWMVIVTIAFGYAIGAVMGLKA
jgi:hypothetical protein